MSGNPVDVTAQLAPIFVVGAPRSGTSLLRNLLNRHPAIGLCDESYYFYYVYGRRRAFGDLADAAARRHLIDSYLATRRVRRLGIPLDDLAALLMRDGTSYDAFFTTLLRFYATFHHKRRYGEKTPQHAFFVRHLCDWYPRCRVIHLVRDPRDVVASLMRMPWSSRNVLVNVKLWRACVAAAERCGGRDNYMLVRYEQLVADPQSELRRICAFLGEEYCAEMREAGAAPAPDAWWFTRALGPITTARRGTWCDELTRENVALIEWIAAPLMRHLGYEPREPTARTAVRLRAAAGAAVDVLQDRVHQLPRIWYYWVRPTRLAAEEAWIERRTHAEPDATIA